MTNIVNINGMLAGSKNEKLNFFVNVFDEVINSCKNKIDKYTKEENYKFLIQNYIVLNKKFSMINSDSAINIFLNKTYELVERQSDMLIKCFTILYMYNLYRIYGNNLNSLSNNELDILFELYMSFDNEYTIKYLDDMTQFIFDDKIKVQLYKYKSDKKTLLSVLENAIEIYLDNGKCNNIPVKYYVSDGLNEVKKRKFSILNDPKLDSVDDIFNYMDKNLSSILELAQANSNDNSKDFNEYLNCMMRQLDDVKEKINTSSVELKNKFIIFAKKVLLSEKNGICGKVDYILNTANVFYSENNIKKK